MGKAVDPGQGYRLLKEGEEIGPGVDVWAYGEGPWEEVDPVDHGKAYSPSGFANGKMHFPMRRRLEPPEAAPAPLAPETPEMSDTQDRIIGEQAKEIVRLAWENARLSKIEGAAHALTAKYMQQDGWAVYRIPEFEPLLLYFGYQTAEEQKKLREWEAAGFPDPNPFQKQAAPAAPTAKPEGTHD